MMTCIGKLIYCFSSPCHSSWLFLFWNARCKWTRRSSVSLSLLLSYSSLPLSNKILSVYILTETNPSFHSLRDSERERWKGKMTSWLDSAVKARVKEALQHNLKPQWKSYIAHVYTYTRARTNSRPVSAALPHTIKFSHSFCAPRFTCMWWEVEGEPTPAWIHPLLAPLSPIASDRVTGKGQREEGLH